MDTKLKNRHKLAVFLIILVITIPSLILMEQYDEFYQTAVSDQERSSEAYLSSEDFLEGFVKCSYVLYNQEKGNEEIQEEEDFPWLWNKYESLYPYMDYQVTDKDDKVISQSLSGSETKLKVQDLSDYEIGLAISYDENGTPSVLKTSDKYSSEQNVALKKALNSSILTEPGNVSGELPQTPVNRTYMYAVTSERLAELMHETYTYSAIESQNVPEMMVYEILFLALFVGAAALYFPMRKSLHTGEEKIFRVPLELPAGILILTVVVVGNNLGYRLSRMSGMYGFMDFVVWCVFFTSCYWTAGCLRRIGAVGFKGYITENTLTYRLCTWIKKHWRDIVNWVKEKINKVYRSLEEIDFKEENNKIIFKIVIINFFILLVLCSLWFFGIIGLIVYSVLLFIMLRKYFNDLRGKYALLLEATNEIAEGNLDVEIDGDLGVFKPFGREIDKIQKGFKKAVDEEVKSQKMKTELITNVSHDLKTPLTAIITYVNLLKEEKDEDKRKDYVEVLERKSMRLKVLIEDLFEISKASSENVTLELVNVDIVNLFKQVKLELEDKIKAADLEFRMELPEEKLILNLDSQKTYRIFENLLVNITKYAMPHTRVYIDMVKEEKEVVIHMKNMSASELNFNPEDITERFVRGDVSRNTEGSGLGLAIAKSFVELQKGTLKIETEADLFKVEIRWKY